MGGKGKKKKSHKFEEESEEEDEEEEYVAKKKMPSKKGKKTKGGSSSKDSLLDVKMKDDVAIEMDDVEGDMKRKRKQRKKKKKMAEHETDEGDEDMGNMKFHPKKGKVDIEDNLLDTEMNEDVTIEIDPIDATYVLELPEEDKVIPDDSDELIKDNMDDPITNVQELPTQENTAVAIDIPDSPRDNAGEPPLEIPDAAVVIEHPDEDVIPQESDAIRYDTDGLDRPGLAEEIVTVAAPNISEGNIEDRPSSGEKKVSMDAGIDMETVVPLERAAVAIDIPESPRGEVGEPPLETHDAAVAIEHPDEDVITQESDAVKYDTDAILDRPGLAEENVTVAAPNVSEGNIEDRPRSGEKKVSIDIETEVPTEREAVAIDIPESPRVEVGEPTFETHDAAVVEHPDEVTVIPQETDFVKDDADALLDRPGLAEENVTVAVPNISEGDIEDRPASADSIGGKKDIGIKPSEFAQEDREDLGNVVDETNIQLGKDDAVDVPMKTMDLLPEPSVPGDEDMEIDTKTEQSAVDQVPLIEKPIDDMPSSRRNYEPNKNEGKELDDQDFNLPEDNEPEDTKTDLPLIENDEELPWAMYKKRKDEKDKEKEANSLPDEIPEITESDSDDYAPSLNKDLPDPFEAMNALDTDDIELNQKTTPHSILDSSKQNVYNKQVDNLKQGIAEDEIKIYLDEFEEHVKQEILMIGNISLEEVQDEERRLREEHILFQQQQAKIQRTRQQEILQAMEKAKKYVMSKHKEKFRELRMREQHLMQKDRSFKDEIHREFRRSESQLRKALKRRKAEVKTMYGDLIFADGQYGGSQGRHWKIDWNRAPQPIQIRLKCLRGVKDKLPESRYVLMISLYNRLGGNVMKWSSLRGQQWGGATLPMHHNGEFCNIELKIDQSVFTVCPSRPDIRPGMVLVFELFILRGPVTPTDKVVGWGCFPICDAEFKVIEGKYKTPMLRGDMDPGIDKFEIIEKLMANDLENWLCNVYFEIIKLPRYMAGQKEYEVELQFTSGLLGAPNRTKTGEENIDGEKAIFGSRSDVNSSLSHHDNKSLRSESIASSLNIDASSDKSIEKPNLNSLTVDIADSRSSSSHRPKSSLSHTNLQMYRAENLSVDLRRQKVEPTKDEMARPMTSVDASRKLVEEKGLQLSDYGSDDSDYRDDDVYALKQDMGFKPVKGEPGMFYKIHHNAPADVYARKVYTMMPKTPVLSQKKVRKKMTHMEILNTHSYAVKTPWSNKGHIEHKGAKKIQYMGRMLFSELGISQVKSRAFWAMILMIIINFWIRLYLHYIGQWVALYAFLIPINSFNFLPYTVQLNYQNTLLRTREEIALIVIGPFTCIILFLLMVLVSAFIQVLFERFPNMFSQFIMAFGIHCALDPIWILIVDSALLRFRNRGGDYPIGDAFKLYWHFNKFYRNDNVTLFISIALTTFLYFVTIFCAITIMYMYFLRIHNNGRLMDVYWRLHCKEESFFIPYDLEISNEELNYICMKAEQWRGEEGERRKTAVYDYIWEEEDMADDNWDDPNISGGKKTGAKETTTHVSVHTLHLDGLRELYRHFLKLPGGAIVEVFGEMNIPGIDEGVKQALIKRTTFQTMTADDGLRKRSVASRSSNGSIRKKDNNLKVSIVDSLGIPAGESVA